MADAEYSSEGEVIKHGGGTAKRSYECTFCKRGFTNAQALGGHMNIHRKDRAKAKQVSPAKDYMINMSPRCYPVMEERNYGVFYPGSSPRHQYGYYESDYVVHRSLQPSSCLSHEEILGANLSLRIESDESQVMRRIMKDDDVDLELRLGHDP